MAARGNAKPGRSGAARKVVLYGILNDKDATLKLRASLVQSLAAEADRLAALVRAKTPVSAGPRRAGNPPPGTLRDKVQAQAVATKHGVMVLVTVDQAVRAPSPKDAPKRRGPVPYGIFVDNETGFLSDTVAGQVGGMFDAVNGGITRYADDTNAAGFPGP